MPANIGRLEVGQLLHLRLERGRAIGGGEKGGERVASGDHQFALGAHLRMRELAVRLERELHRETAAREIALVRAVPTRCAPAERAWVRNR